MIMFYDQNQTLVCQSYNPPPPRFVVVVFVVVVERQKYSNNRCKVDRILTFLMLFVESTITFVSFQDSCQSTERHLQTQNKSVTLHKPQTTSTQRGGAGIIQCLCQNIKHEVQQWQAHALTKRSTGSFNTRYQSTADAARCQSLFVVE